MLATLYNIYDKLSSLEGVCFSSKRYERDSAIYTKYILAADQLGAKVYKHRVLIKKDIII